MSKYKIIKIQTKLDILRTVDCLKIGMNMDDAWAYRLIKNLLIKNEKKDFYGFAIEKDEIIFGGIITFFQGSHKDNCGTFRDIYNLSTFYVDQELRGILSIALAKKLIKYLDNCLLTNYTASFKVQKILKSLGFKDMKSLDYRINSFRFGNFYIDRNLNIERSKFFDLSNFDSFKLNFYQKEPLIFLKYNSIDLKIIGIVSYKKIKFIKLPFFTILWSSNDILLMTNLKKIKKYLFQKYYCLGIQIFSHMLEKDKISKGLFRNSNFLIKSPVKVNYIPPLGSEFEAQLF